MANDNNISQIETNGVNPVPDSERYGKPADLFPIWFSWNISIFGITCGMYVFAWDFSVAQAMAAGVIVISYLVSLVGILAVGSVRTGASDLSAIALGFRLPRQQSPHLLRLCCEHGLESDNAFHGFDHFCRLSG